MESRTFYLGLDLGQRVDHSAFCLVEIVESKAVVKLLVKYPLGTGYPLVMETVAETYKSLTGYHRAGDFMGDVSTFAVDATGVGSEPARHLQTLLPEARIEPFIFTNQKKRELVGKVKVMHAFGRLKFARRKGDEVYNRTLSELITEMKQVQAKVIREDAINPEIEIFKTGAHDDLFTALALAVKDIQFEDGWTDFQPFIPDKTWTHTPLDETPKQPDIFFF
ncbi:MAG TPA: hypothetical protein VJR06_01210 [Nitrososphaerales archaeon]|nr:hypothetical protein [Nitrososphaerales archaeon]